MQPLVDQRRYSPLQSPSPGLGQKSPGGFSGLLASGPCRCCLGCLAVACCLLLFFLWVVLPGFLYPSDAPTALSPCRDVLPLDACAWGKGLFCRTGRGQAWCATTCGICSPFYDGNFFLRSIANDNVENELAYAKVDSPLPESLQGIWWMDQWGSNLPIPSDPGYPYHFPLACNELLVTFGEVFWEPDSLCTSPNWKNGGPMGHWTFNDIGGGKSNVWLGPNMPGFFKFCFTSPAFDEIEVWLGLYFPTEGAHVLDLLGWEKVGGGFDGFYWVPPGLMRFGMVKKPWGWDRVTENFLSDLPAATQAKLIEILPEDLKAFATMAQRVAHYPVFQIVDGAGQRTSNYDAYLREANNDTGADCVCDGGCGCPCRINQGRGTSLVSLWTPNPPGSPPR